MNRLTRVASRFVNTPLMIHPPKLDVMVQALGPRLGILPGAQIKLEGPLASAYTEEANGNGYDVVDGIAVIPIQGVLTKKESWIGAFSGCSSYEQLAGNLQDAVSDAGVRAILLQVDSPGGETTGCLELSDFIYSLRGVKPIFAVADDFAFSAAYALASAAEKIFVTRMGAVGSIGVVVLHAEDSKANGVQGLKYTYIFKGDKKVDANPHEPLSDRARDDIQSEIDRQYDQFVATVARNRGADSGKIVATQAGLYWAETAIPLLADEVGTFGDAVNALRQLLGEPGRTSTAAIAASQKGKTIIMADEQLPPAVEGKKPDDGDDDSQEPNFCHACGAKLHAGAKFCHACGETVPGGANKAEGAKTPVGATAGAAPKPAAAAEAVKMRPEADVQAIAALCKTAGCPEKAADFLMKKNGSGQYLSVTEVSDALTAARVAESERSMISSHVNPGAGSGGVQELEAQAVAFARQNRGSVTNGLYVSGASTRVTKERAYAQMLEEHPEAYAAFRAQHNAKGMIATLEAAGIRLAR
jgi:signal peptide peptidase SppA